MSDEEALAETIRRTGHTRFRDLLDPSHPAYSPAYWPVVRQIAQSDSPGDDPVLIEALHCPDRINTGRPCRCEWRCSDDGQLVTLQDCLDCVAESRSTSQPTASPGAG